MGFLLHRGPRRLVATPDRLEWIHVTAAGVDTLLFDELRDSDVVVTNARGVFDRPMAEYVLGAVIAYAKDSRHQLRPATAPRVAHRETRRITGATALVVGTGGIGREIARLLRAAGMVVRGAGRRAVADDPDFGEIVDSANLAAEVGWCDHLILAAPLTAATRGLVDAQVLAAMKPDAHLINIARGPMVDESALLEALTARRIGGATLDVFNTEPLPPDHPLWDAPNVTITAHMSADAVGWRRHPGRPVRGERPPMAGRRTVAQRGGQEAWLRIPAGRDGMIPSAASSSRATGDKTISPVEATQAALDAIDPTTAR